MKQVSPDQYSQAPIFIHLLFEDEELAVATAFVYSKDGNNYLVSNWHNFSGRDPKTNKPIHSQCALPNKLRAHVCKNQKHIERTDVDYLLIDNDSACWLEHPVHKENIDIGVLPIDVHESIRVFPINEMQSTDLRLSVSHDVYILGYPLGITDAHILPIWKRASVATEPGLSFPSFFVDTATRKGMSGSPVVQRYRGFYKQDLKREGVSGNDWFGEGDSFIGVYSGRLGASSIEAQLGIVWKKHLIDEIIDGNCICEQH